LALDYDFTDAELTSFRVHQEAHMMDTGNVQPISVAGDTFGQDVDSWPNNDGAIDCGLDMRPGSERHGVEKTVVEYDATVRVPIETTVDLRDRFRITKRFGETLSTYLVFNIVSPPQRGPSGIRLLLQRIET